MYLAYNSNGLAHHKPEDALPLLKDLGYRGIGLTLDHGWLDPFDPGFERELGHWGERLSATGLLCVVETGARFLLDPRRKHEPTLVSATPEHRAHRGASLRRAVNAAVALPSPPAGPVVSLWSGVVRDGCRRDEAFARLADSLGPLLEYAAARGVTLGFEPEPGMLVSTLQDFAELKHHVGHRAAHAPLDGLRLTADLGHLHCNGETPLPDRIREVAAGIVNVHIEDMRRGVHEHLMFGDGEIDFPPVVAALRGIGYAGPLCVELSRHSHVAPDAARAAAEFLLPLIGPGAQSEPCRE